MHRARFVSLLFLSSALFATVAYAQTLGRDRRLSGPPMGPPRSMSALQTPLPILVFELKLTESQKSKVEAIRNEFEKKRGRPGPPRDGRPGGPPPDDRGGDFGRPPPPPDGHDGGPDGPPPPRPGREEPPAMRAREVEALKKLESVLNEDQKKALPGLARILNSLREGGIPLPVYLELSLSSDQKSRINEIAKSARETSRRQMEEARSGGDREAGRATMDKMFRRTHEKVLNALSEPQRKAVAKFEKDLPRRSHGGPPPGEGEGPPPQLTE